MDELEEAFFLAMAVIIMVFIYIAYYTLVDTKMEKTCIDGVEYYVHGKDLTPVVNGNEYIVQCKK